MLTLLTIKNIALIDHLSVEFGHGLNLLTGETGSGKSIIVDSLGALTGERVSSDLIQSGETAAAIEGLFALTDTARLRETLTESGLEIEGDAEIELIVRRELSSSGKNRIFINDQLVTQGFLKRVGPFLVDIHGQGEQAALYDTDSHIRVLDRFADNASLIGQVTEAYHEMASVRAELAALEQDESEKLQVLDILRFQVDEITRAALSATEDLELDEEKRKLNNVEKLTSLSSEAFDLLYDNEESTSATLDKAARKIGELAHFDTRFAGYNEGLASARAVIEDLAISVRDFRAGLDFSPERLEAIETRLAEIARLKRKYGGTIETVLDHLEKSKARLENIEFAEIRKEELLNQFAQLRTVYLQLAGKLHDRRTAAAKRFEKQVVQDLQAVALEKARFEVRIEANEVDDLFGTRGFDSVEFYFSANPGELPKPLAKIASGGEASRLMLILKTAAGTGTVRTTVFDEIDVGIGGRVAEAVGRKLKDLAATQQVLCVTHQPQIASLADRHFLVEKKMSGIRTSVETRELNPDEKIEEIARMLAGETVTDAARENAKAMLASY